MENSRREHPQYVGAYGLLILILGENDFLSSGKSHQLAEDTPHPRRSSLHHCIDITRQQFDSKNVRMVLFLFRCKFCPTLSVPLEHVTVLILHGCYDTLSFISKMFLLWLSNFLYNRKTEAAQENIGKLNR